MLYWVTLKPPKGIQMKHILILISILLLSSPLFGQSKKSGLLYIMENGSRYVGEWEDGKKHGQGTYTYSDGPKYVGEYKDDKKHGQGTFIWSNGDKYVGEYKDGEENSQGTYTWSNGDKYVGEYKDGKKHGQGKFTYTDGGWYDGSWKEGQSWTGITYDKDGNISYEKVSGEIQYKQ